MKKFLWSAGSLILVASPAAALGGVAVFEGQPGGLGSVHVYDEQSGAALSAPAELQGILLLAIDFTGRTALQEFLPGQPRLREDLAGASRLEFQNGKGSLYRYSRGLPSGAAMFGFMHVDHDGNARSLCEVQGVGPALSDDPFLWRIAVSPSSDAFLVATLQSAGGNLLEVAIAGAPSVIDRTPNLPPRRFSSAGLALSNDFGVGVFKRALLRFSRTSGAVGETLNFGSDPYPSVFSGQVVLSRNGQWAATTAGANLGALHVYAFDATGIARRASLLPDQLSGAGFLPEAQDGPHLAVSNDGSTCAWRSEQQLVLGGISRECFVGHVQAPPGDDPQQLSSDALFPDTLDEVGLFHFRLPNQLFIGVGGRLAPNVSAIENMDFFQVDVAAGPSPAVFTNLSLSSGIATAPFLPAIPQITPERVALIPDSSGIVYFDGSGQHGKVYAARAGQTGSALLLQNVKQVDMQEVASGWTLLSLRRSDGTKPYELYRIPLDMSAPPALIVSMDNTNYVRPATRRDGWVAYVTANVTGEFLNRVDLVSGTLEQFQTPPAVYGPTLGLTAQGSFTFSIGALGLPSTFMTWPAGGATPVVLQTPTTPGHILPGS